MRLAPFDLRRVLPVLAILPALCQCTCAAPAEEGLQDQPAEKAPVGVLLGHFFLRDFRAVEGTKLRLSFSLYAEVPAESEEATRKLIESHQHRIRDAIITATRIAEQNEYEDPGLERFRRRVVVRLRRQAPDLVFDRLLVGEFELLLD